MTVEATTALLDRLRRHFIKPGEALPGGTLLAVPHHEPEAVR